MNLIEKDLKRIYLEGTKEEKEKAVQEVKLWIEERGGVIQDMMLIAERNLVRFKDFFYLHSVEELCTNKHVSFLWIFSSFGSHELYLDEEYRTSGTKLLDIIESTLHVYSYFYYDKEKEALSRVSKEQARKLIESR